MISNGVPYFGTTGNCRTANAGRKALPFSDEFTTAKRPVQQSTAPQLRVLRVDAALGNVKRNTRSDAPIISRHMFGWRAITKSRARKRLRRRSERSESGQPDVAPHRISI